MTSNDKPEPGSGVRLETIPLGVQDPSLMQVLPLVEEELRIERREVVTGRVRVRVSTETEERLVAQDLTSEEVDVERVPVGTYLEAGAPVPQVRTENDVTIVPILEEVLVVEKRLLVREELHIRRRISTEHTETPVTLRKQKAEIEHIPVDSRTSSAPNADKED
ncbi:MAG: YsnF/AvaK domain-containing protein [Microvirga sp.]